VEFRIPVFGMRKGGWDMHEKGLGDRTAVEECGGGRRNGKWILIPCITASYPVEIQALKPLTLSGNTSSRGCGKV
jgi:hypothetical protein